VIAAPQPEIVGPRVAVFPALLAAALLVLGGPANGGSAERPRWRATQGEVRVICPMTVGGSFDARTTALDGVLAAAADKPPAFDGSLRVDLRTLRTGIDLRDEHLREKYLEVGKGPAYEAAVLTDLRLGPGASDTADGRTTFTGTMALHGTTRPVAGQAEVRHDGANVHVTASFPLTLTDYGIAKPQYLGVGVRNEVQVRVSLLAAPEPAGAGR
jgi:polyisoprenoid-binding protein YceI